MNVAGARLKVPPVLFDVCDSVTVADPIATGVTVSVGVTPQLVNVIEDGLTVATPALLELTATTRVADPVRLQPFLPSAFRGVTESPAEP